MPLDAAPDLLALLSDPRLDRAALVTVRGWRLLVADPIALIRSLAELDRYAEAVGWRGPQPRVPPFATAAVGYVSDDVTAALLELPPDGRPAVAELPPLQFGVYTWAVAVSEAGDAWVVAEPERIAEVCRWATATTGAVDADPAARIARVSMTRSAHGSAVEQIQDWIAAGDLYQANLTFQVSVAWPESAPLLARRLGSATPGAAHAAVLAVDRSTAIVSASPETFLRVEGDTVTTRPIKGTARRWPDPRRDREAGAALTASVKDHAEHVMIVDLERNDLGRVCVPGSVRVPDYAALEAHPTVWHLTSTVQGTLRPAVTLGELLRATFPPGSVTGTPKRMAVARTALLEPVRRGVYCGAIGVVGPGLVDLSVAIRTAVVAGGTASYGAGGAIVTDSDPDAEYDEALDKAAAFLTATQARSSSPEGVRVRV